MLRKKIQTQKMIVKILKIVVVVEIQLQQSRNQNKMITSFLVYLNKVKNTNIE
jgi:hypothetical protein